MLVKNANDMFYESKRWKSLVLVPFPSLTRGPPLAAWYDSFQVTFLAFIRIFIVVHIHRCSSRYINGIT